MAKKLLEITQDKIRFKYHNKKHPKLANAVLQSESFFISF